MKLSSDKANLQLVGVEQLTHLAALEEASALTLGELQSLHRLLLPSRDADDLVATFFASGMKRFHPIEVLQKNVDDALALKTFKDGKPMKRADQEAAIRFALLWVACDYFCNALHLQSSGYPELSWKHLFESRRWTSYVLGRSSIQTVTSASRLGLDKVHAENRAAKRDVFTWLDQNRIHNGRPDFKGKGKTMEATAELISRTIVKVAFRTAHGYITEWKKLRATDRQASIG